MTEESTVQNAYRRLFPTSQTPGAKVSHVRTPPVSHSLQFPIAPRWLKNNDEAHPHAFLPIAGVNAFGIPYTLQSSDSLNRLVDSSNTRAQGSFFLAQILLHHVLERFLVDHGARTGAFSLLLQVRA